MPKGLPPDRYRDLLESKALAHFATVDPNGRPQVNPVWFIWKGVISCSASKPKPASIRTCGPIPMSRCPSLIRCDPTAIWSFAARSPTSSFSTHWPGSTSCQTSTRARTTPAVRTANSATRSRFASIPGLHRTEPGGIEGTVCGLPGRSDWHDCCSASMNFLGPRRKKGGNTRGCSYCCHQIF